LSALPATSAAEPASDLAAAEARQSELLALKADASQDLAQASRLVKRLDRRLEILDFEIDERRREISSQETAVIEERIEAAAFVASEESEYSSAVEQRGKDRGALLGLALGLALIGSVIVGRERIAKTRLAQVVLSQDSASLIALFVFGFLFSAIFVLLANSPVAIGVGVFLGVTTLGLGLIGNSARRVIRSDDDGVVRRRRLAAIPLSILILLLFLAAGLSSGASALLPKPTEPNIPDETERLAEQAEGDPLEPVPEEITEAQDELAPIIVARDEARNSRRIAYRSFRTSRRIVRRSNRALARTNRTIRVAQRQLDRQALAPAPPSGGDSFSLPSTCAGAPSNIPVPPGSPLDGDGDGIGCES
jgi:hypothetical protein